MILVASRRSVTCSQECPNQSNRSAKPVFNHRVYYLLVCLDPGPGETENTVCVYVNCTCVSVQDGESEGAGSQRPSWSQKRSLHQPEDLEDLTTSTTHTPHPPTVTKYRRTLTSSQRQLLQRETWRDVLGQPPAMGTTKVHVHVVLYMCNFMVHVHVYMYS